MRILIKTILFAASTISLHLMAAHENFEIPDKLPEKSFPINNEDSIALDSLFRILFSEGDFAYTLFGDKPMALVDFCVDLRLGLNQATLHTIATIYKGWLVWQKYKSSFPNNSFVFFDYISPEGDFIGFILYHKSKVNDLYMNYKPLMDSVFENVDQIPARICFFKENLQFQSNENAYHEALGLLLGYDPINTKRFCQRALLIDTISITPLAIDGLNDRNIEFVLLNRRTGKKVNVDSSDFTPLRSSNLIQQLNLLSGQMKPINLSQREFFLSPLKSPKLMAVEGKMEITKMQKSYDKIRDKLIEIYFSEDFLEIILSRLQS